MSKRLVVLDVDSTLIENEVIELLAQKAGVFNEVQKITDRAMRGEIDFRQSLGERVAMLAGLPETIFENVRDEISVTKGAAKLISHVQQSGGLVGVVSGGFIEVLDPLAQRLGVNFWKANSLEIHEGVLTGKVLEPIIDAQAKADALVEWANGNEISEENTVAIGDGANDLLMMEKAGLSIAFCAKPIVQESADVAINVRDLSLALDVMGI
jgi:phosphoserine phosphatase